MNLESNNQLRLAAEFVRSTNTNLFLTGRAGTGKTTFLRNLKEITFKRFVVVAPTGVAAINARGVTIHSFFQLPFGPQIPEELQKLYSGEQVDAKASAARFQRFTREKINIIRSLDLLVIDEISMVRADLLDAIDAVLRRYKNRYQPFGGLQLLMIGDLQQLAPIAKDDEWEMLRKYYDSVYFFSSNALKQTDYVSIELNQVFRQSDPHFIQLLNKVRDSQPDTETIAELNKRYLPDFVATDPEGYITLTTHNNQAHFINQTKLDKLPGKAQKFTAETSGEFPEYNYPTDFELLLKEGVQVMFVKNDPSPAKLFFNGKIGKLMDIDTEDETLTVQCPEDDEPIYVSRLEWQNTKYSLNEESKEIEESVIGTFKQYPLKLAWAITIHKSQGLTFDKAIIDAQAAFTHGQVYVALSRCSTLEGMVFRSAIQASAIKSNVTVSSYLQKVDENSPDENKLLEAKARYQMQLVKELFDFSIINRRLDYLLKICNENSQSLDLSFIENYRSVSKKLAAEFLDLSRKFHVQIQNLALQQPDLENNLELQERVKKASVYFKPRLKSLYEEMDMAIETDNKAVKKSLQDALERLLNDASVKLACLKEGEQGFKISFYLEVRAKASIDGAEKKKKVTKDTYSSKSQYKEIPFYNVLKKWRDNLAEEDGIEYHEIMPLRTMKEIAQKLPASRIELLKVHGMGRTRVKKYGNEILELIKSFSETNDLDIEPDFSPLPVQKPKIEKVPSSKLTFELFKEGKSIEEIAKIRGFAVSTIESHLADYIRLGDLTLQDVMPAEKARLVIEYFTDTEDLRFGPAKQVLGDEISYGQLRMVLVYLQAKGLLPIPEQPTD
ncbi:MAG: helix-turn-helix domain-containing protein [Bacteroidales bacterium]|nr:helix-turn-helix domain-containing protein [Bacteroidales bacterium]